MEKDKQLTRGLIIDQPWIDKILRGEKIWEMRSTNTLIRGQIGLIKKGSGTVVGVAQLVESKGPLSFEEIFDNEKFHCVGPEIYSRPDYKWDHAWMFSDVVALKEPIPYKHKSGAVIWVELDDDAKKSIQLVLSSSDHTKSLDNDRHLECVSEKSFSRKFHVPVARDGTHFCQRTCRRSGHYIVGDKGNERTFSDYRSALAYLEKMPVAKWRRPNQVGNWGIVSAVRWEIR